MTKWREYRITHISDEDFDFKINNGKEITVIEIGALTEAQEKIKQLEAEIEKFNRCNDQSTITIRETAKENVTLRTKIKKLEAENKELVESLIKVKDECLNIYDTHLITRSIEETLNKLGKL